MARRDGVILSVVLFMLLLLGLMGAVFSFRVNADLAATQAVVYRLQTRLAAQAGLERVKLMLPTAQWDFDRWYNNPEELHRIVVWASDTEPGVWGTNEELGEGGSTYRFSIVADDPTDDEKYVRFGITDESAKLNLNTADEWQLLSLVTNATLGETEVDPQDIVDAILDWRDADKNERGEQTGTEGEYYRQLNHPYRVANKDFETVEELLLVKGVTAAILYGEDFDRNGLLTPNEDDGDDTFPLDNADGTLNRGLYPYLTVHSYDEDVSNDRRARIYLYGDEGAVRDALTEVFDGDGAIVDYIVEVTRAQGPGAAGGNDAGRSGGGGSPATGRSGGKPSANTGTPAGRRGDKSERRQQRREDGSEEEPGDESGTDDESGDPVISEDGEDGDGQSGGDESDDAQTDVPPIRSPASLALARSIRGELRPSPVGLEYLELLMDRTTIRPPAERTVVGLININTAPVPVLRTFRDLTEDDVQSIVDARGSLDAEDKLTTAWLAVHEIIPLETYERIAPFITARGRQFTIESLGYADHVGMVSRLQIVVDMVGSIPQTIYYRDLTALGGHYPIREKDRENVRVR